MKEVKEKLTDQQELFCRYYTTPDTDTFLNATIAYAEAYGYDLASLSKERAKDSDNKDIPNTSEYERAYNTCQANGSRLLSNDMVRERKDTLLVAFFDSDIVADARLQTIILKGNDTNAINAIKHRSELKQRVIKKLDITTANRPLGNLSDEELLKLAGGN